MRIIPAAKQTLRSGDSHAKCGTNRLCLFINPGKRARMIVHAVLTQQKPSHCKPCNAMAILQSGGVERIRTSAPVTQPNDLANRPLQPLEYHSIDGRGSRRYVHHTRPVLYRMARVHLYALRLTTCIIITSCLFLVNHISPFYFRHLII